MSTVPRGAAAPPVVEKREFWVLMGYAAARTGVINLGAEWYTDSRPGWFGRHWRWVAVTTAAGVAVGLLRRLTRLPEEILGVFGDLRAEHVDPALVPGTVAASVMSLITRSVMSSAVAGMPAPMPWTASRDLPVLSASATTVGGRSRNDRFDICRTDV